MSDPLRDLERRVDSLAAKVDLSDQGIRSDLEAIRVDVERIKADASGFVTLARFRPLESLFWISIGAIVVGMIGAVVAITTRSP